MLTDNKYMTLRETAAVIAMCLVFISTFTPWYNIGSTTYSGTESNGVIVSFVSCFMIGLFFARFYAAATVVGFINCFVIIWSYNGILNNYFAVVQWGWFMSIFTSIVATIAAHECHREFKGLI